MSTGSKDDYTAVWEGIIRANTELTDLAVFINSKHPNNLEIEKIKENIKLLVDGFGCTYTGIRNGSADELLLPLLGIDSGKIDSVEDSNEKHEMCPLKYTRKKVDSKTRVKRWILGLIIASSFFVGANALIDNFKDAKDAYKNMSIVTAEASQIENASNDTLVDQCKEIVGYNHGAPIYSLNLDLLAQKIEYLCSLNKDLFHVYLSNVYFGLESGRLNTMSAVLNKLQHNFKVNEDYQDLYNEIKDCSDYLDYMLSLGLINSDRSDYSDIINAVNKYKMYANESNNLWPYGSLTESEQKEINKIREAYREYKNIQNYKNGDEIAELKETANLNQDFGGRSSGS